MKRVLLPLAFLFCVASASAVDLSFAALFNYDLVRENGALILDRKKVSDLAYFGVLIDVPVSERGSLIILDAVKFEDTGRTQAYNKNIHWDSNFLYAHHLVGREHFLDPYVAFGAGCSGAVFFDDRADQWQTRTQIVIFPEAGAGLALHFSDLVVGAHARTQLLSFNPSPLKTYEQLPVAVALSFGVKL